jgi:hypothetical protein
MYFLNKIESSVEQRLKSMREGAAINRYESITPAL